MADVFNVLDSRDLLVATLTRETIESTVPSLSDPLSPPERQINRLLAFVLIVPVDLAPHTVFMATQQLLPFLEACDPLVSNGVAMRLAQAALLLNATDEAMQILNSPDLGNTVIPILYLSASLRSPVAIDPSHFPATERLSALAHYYSGLNHLLLRDFSKARADLFRALTRKSRGDFSTEIVQAFLLACFLTHFTLAQSKSLVPPTIEIGEESLTLWNFEAELGAIPPISAELVTDIVTERKMRHLLELSQVFSRIPVHTLMGKMGFTDVAELQSDLARLVREEWLGYQVENEIITFSLPDLSRQIQKQTQEFQELKQQIEADRAIEDKMREDELPAFSDGSDSG
jgi:hypothetical protein